MGRSARSPATTGKTRGGLKACRKYKQIESTGQTPIIYVRQPVAKNRINDADKSRVQV